MAKKKKKKTKTNIYLFGDWYPIIISCYVCSFLCIGAVNRTKCFNVVLERSLMLEVKTANTKLVLYTILLVGLPVTFQSQELPTLVTCKGLHSVLPLVMGLQSSKIF
ncbi:hypothetical protein ACB092_10G124500 [Castanea dentata]